MRAEEAETPLDIDAPELEAKEVLQIKDTPGVNLLHQPATVSPVKSSPKNDFTSKVEGSELSKRKQSLILSLDMDEDAQIQQLQQS